LLIDHEIQTAQEMGWGRLKNGELIRRADEANFEVFVTSDQNLSDRRIALLILSTNYWPTLRDESERVQAALAEVVPGQYVELVL
jgi:hypothetical protein